RDTFGRRAPFWCDVDVPVASTTTTDLKGQDGAQRPANVDAIQQAQGAHHSPNLPVAGLGRELSPQRWYAGRFRDLRAVDQAGVHHDDAERFGNLHRPVVDRQRHGQFVLARLERACNVGRVVVDAEKLGT